MATPRQPVGLTRFDGHHQGFASEGCPAMESMRKKPLCRCSLSLEFKAEIVELYLRSDRSVGQVGQNFDLDGDRGAELS